MICTTGDLWGNRKVTFIFPSDYTDVIMRAMASPITGVSIVYSAVYSGTDERKHQSSASLAFVRGIHRWPVNSPHKGPVTRKMFPFDDVIMGKSQSWVRQAARCHDVTIMGRLCDLFIVNLNTQLDNKAPSQYKDRLSKYGEFHYKDTETVVRPSYLYNGNPYTGIFILKRP